MKLTGLFDLAELNDAILNKHVRMQLHPGLPLRILNYTEQCAYDGAWNNVTRQCRGLIYHSETLEVVARPFPKFFNHGEPAAPELDLDEPVEVTDKLDGSLGILYPTPDALGAIATRGSFTSDQAMHATAVWQARYSPTIPGLWSRTYLFEIIYPENRIVVDYGDTDDLILIAVLSTETGLSLGLEATPWTGPRTDVFHHDTLRAALEAEPRPNSEGLVVYFPNRDIRVKIKQDDYVALHRILTGTNARHVWEYAAVKACTGLVTDQKHWASFLGIDPARAEELLAVEGDEWLAGVPDEFYSWVRSVIDTATKQVEQTIEDCHELAKVAAGFNDRRAQFEYVAGNPFQMEIMRLVNAQGDDDIQHALNRLALRAWREACPEPTAPFARTEAIA